MRIADTTLSIILSLCCLGFSIICAGSTTIDINDEYQQTTLDRNFYRHFEDQEGLLSLTEAIRQSKKWPTPPQPQALKNYTSSSHWFALDIENKLSIHQDLIYEYRHPRTDHIEFYTLHGEQVTSRYETSSRQPFASRPIDHPHFLFPVALEPGQSLTILIKIKGRPKYIVEKTTLWDESSYLFATRSQFSFHWFLIGMFSVMVLYNAVIGVFTKDISYLWYICYVSAIVLLTFANTGLGFQLLWPNNIWFEQHALTSMGYINNVFLGLFAIDLMNLREQAPTIVHFIRGWMLLIVIAGVSTAILPFSYTIVFVAGFAVSFPFVIFLWLVGIHLWRKGNQAAKYYVISWTFPLIAACILVYSYIFLSGAIALLNETATAVQLVFLSMALASRINGLMRSEYQAKAENRAKSGFLAKMSHEIRTPMSGVLGMSELLRGMELNKQQSKCNDVIYASGQALLTVINDILDYSKIEAGKMSIESIPFDLEKLVWEVLNIFRLETEGKNNHLMADIDPRIPRWVVGDQSRIRQIMINLLSNAIKFTEQGDVMLRILPTEDNELIRIEVIDQGIGISKNNQQKLFHAFSQAEDSTSRYFGGTGLGLAICKQLAQLMGGDIGVESKVGEGSTFWVSLNLPGSTDSDTPAPPDVAQLAGKRLLFIDDNTTYRRIISPITQSWNMIIKTCNGAREALAELAQNQNYDLIMSAVHMPEMTGIEFARTLQQDSKLSEIPLVLVTAFRNRPIDQEALDLMVEDKPLVAFELRDLLYRSLSLDETVQENIESTAHSGNSLPRYPSMSILVADDNAVNRLVIDGLLKSLDQKVTLVENGIQAIDAVEQQTQTHRYDLILMDCEMPEMNGFDASQRIRQRERDLRLQHQPIFALTAHVMQEHLDRCKRCGMDDYLTKPIDSDKLKGVLLRVAAHRDSSSDQMLNTSI